MFGNIMLRCCVDNSNTSVDVDNITGILKLISLDSKITSTTQQGPTRTVTLTDFISPNTTGTITFTALKVISNGIGYSVNTNANVEYMRKLHCFRNIPMPFQLTTPAF